MAFETKFLRQSLQKASGSFWNRHELTTSEVSKHPAVLSSHRPVRGSPRVAKNTESTLVLRRLAVGIGAGRASRAERAPQEPRFRCNSCEPSNRYRTQGRTPDGQPWPVGRTVPRSSTLESAAMLRIPGPPSTVVLRGLTAICLVAVASTARGDVAWHDSLPTARAACATSGRPVLAIFVASWSPEATRFREQTLASARGERPDRSLLRGHDHRRR